MIVTPCPHCQANVELYQDEINRKQGTKFALVERPSARTVRAGPISSDFPKSLDKCQGNLRVG